MLNSSNTLKQSDIIKVYKIFLIQEYLNCVACMNIIYYNLKQEIHRGSTFQSRRVAKTFIDVRLFG